MFPLLLRKFRLNASYLLVSQNKMDCQTVSISRIIRRMRGGSQAQLVQGDNTQFYVAKFCGNPQGNRTLVNEWIASKLYQKLELSTPPLVLLRLDGSVGKSDDFCFQVGNRKIAIEPGVHLGSCCPVNPNKTTMYDFLPSRLLHRTRNLDEFAIAFFLDTLLGQTDSRQAVFTREHTQTESLFRAHFVDHGMAFDGAAWQFRDHVSHALYYNRQIYSLIDIGLAWEKNCDALAAIDSEFLFRTIDEIPTAWLAPGDSDALAKLFAQLIRRIDKLDLLVYEKLENLDKERHKSIKFHKPVASRKVAVEDYWYPSMEIVGTNRLRSQREGFDESLL